MGSRSDESIRRRKVWRDGDAAFRQNFLVACSVIATPLKRVKFTIHCAGNDTYLLAVCFAFVLHFFLFVLYCYRVMVNKVLYINWSSNFLSMYATISIYLLSAVLSTCKAYACEWSSTDRRYAGVESVAHQITALCLDCTSLQHTSYLLNGIK